MHEDPASSQIADCVCTTMDSINQTRKKKTGYFFPVSFLFLVPCFSLARCILLVYCMYVLRLIPSVSTACKAKRERKKEREIKHLNDPGGWWGGRG